MLPKAVEPSRRHRGTAVFIGILSCLDVYRNHAAGTVALLSIFAWLKPKFDNLHRVASRNVTIFSICLQTQLSLYVTIFYQICWFHSYADYIGNLVFWSSHAMIAEESCVD